MELFGELINFIDDIKQRIKDCQYKDILDSIIKIQERYNELYIVEYWEQTIRPRFGTRHDIDGYKIDIEKKYIIAKFCKESYNDNDMIEECIKCFSYMSDILIENESSDCACSNCIENIPTIKSYKGTNVYIKHPNSELNDEDGDNDISIRFAQFIPISIKRY